MSLMPLLFFLFCIGLFIFFLAKTKIFKNYWVLLIYVLLLLCSVGFSFLIIEEKSGGEEWSFEEAEESGIMLYERAGVGKEEEIPVEFMREKWNFSYSNEELTVETQENMINGINIFLERKEENDGDIDVLFFQTPSSVEGIKVTPSSLPDIQQVNSTLRITNMNNTRLKYSTFKEEFPFRKATEISGFIDSSSISLGRTLLYLRVPKDLELNMDPHEITEVGYKKEGENST